MDSVSQSWKAAFIVVAVFAAHPARATDPGFDLMIRGAEVVDGSGQAPFNADILVRGGAIAFVGHAPAGVQAARVIEAEGRVAAPGFIDAHAHGQALDAGQTFENELAMGVTTIVLGQDGANPDSVTLEPGPGHRTLADWYALLGKNPPTLNIAALVGVGSVRAEAGAPDNGPTTAAQIERMQSLIDRGIGDGAFGVSLRLDSAPMSGATPEELESIAKVTGRHDGIVMAPVRTADDDKVGAAVDELLAMGRFARVHIAHIRVVHGKTAAQGDIVMAQLAAAKARGVTVTADVYPYLASEIGSDGSATSFTMSEATQDRFIMNPDVMISTDGAPGLRHPRAYGSFARMIETYVMKNHLPLPLAVRKMAALAADALKLPYRGLLRPGYKADIVLFSSAKVHETATWDRPMQLAVGFDVVIVNGKVARENGVLTAARFGQVLRNAP